MFDFLTDRFRQRKAQRAALSDQEAQREERLERLKGMVALLRDLLKDTRYGAYTQLLKDARQALLAEREGLLQTTDDLSAHYVAVLTGRIMQLDYILSTPDQFFALAEQGEANGTAARSLAREPVR